MSSLIRSLPTAVFYSMLAFPLAMAGLVLFVALRSRARVRLMAATPTSLVAGARDGRCELSGRAEAIEGLTLRAPLTDAECCWWSARVEERVRSADSRPSGTWRTVREGTSDAPFLLRDGTGACVVFPCGAEVTGTDHSLWHGSSPVPDDRSPPRVGPGESAKGMRSLETGDFRYREERIYPGDPLYALGDFTSEPLAADGGGDEDDAHEAEPNAPLDTARVAGPGGDDWRDETLLEKLEVRAAALGPGRIRRASREPFLLSTTPEQKLAEVQELAWKGALGVAVLPAALAALALWLRCG